MNKSKKPTGKLYFLKGGNSNSDIETIQEKIIKIFNKRKITNGKGLKIIPKYLRKD